VRPYLIAITGGSGSGKSTLARALAAALAPVPVTLVSEDDYYLDSASLPGFEAAAYNFDEPAARDHALLRAHLAALCAGETVAKPSYDFARHARALQTTPLAPGPVMIVEGIHVLCDADLADAFDLRVFVDTPEALRLGRRLVRDCAPVEAGGRARDPAGVFEQFFRTVAPMHDAHTGPSKARADLVVSDTEAFCAAGETPKADAAAIIAAAVRERLAERTR
jgi:uridine kinase